MQKKKIKIFFLYNIIIDNILHSKMYFFLKKNTF